MTEMMMMTMTTTPGGFHDLYGKHHCAAQEGLKVANNRADL
jgi:hypothetical protein